jgi:hypothetical protein
MTRLGIFLCVIAAFLGLAQRAHAGPFEVRDTGWEGCSELFELARQELGEGRVAVLSELDWKAVKPEDALLILHPARTISGDRLRNFLRGGGRVAIIDDFGAGSRILGHFGIERIPTPSRPVATLRHKAELAIAEPVRDAVSGGEGVHPTVENVERLVTNHPTGLRHPKMGPVLKIRGIDEPDVALALAGQLDNAPLGKLFAMGDPSALINQMLRYPGTRAFATGLIHFLAADFGGEGRPLGVGRGRLLVLANDFTETGVSDGPLGDLANDLDARAEAALGELRKLFQGGLSGLVGVVAAALVALGVGLWTTSVASRIYQRKVPSFVRPIGALSQGGTAGRTAVLTARTTPAALIVLELKSALEEGIAHDLGFASNLPPTQLLAEVANKRVLDERRQATLKAALLEMAEVETMVTAGQPQVVGKSDATRLGAIVFDLLQAVRTAVRERSAA